MNFSLILITYNRSKLLKKTIKNILQLSYQDNWQLILVNNNSKDNTREVCLSFVKKNSRVSYVFEPKQGHYFGLLSGIKKAKYSRIICVDDDTPVSANFLNELKKTYFKYPNAALIGGPIKPVPDDKKKLILSNFLKQNLWILGGVSFGNKIKILKYPENLLFGNVSFNLKKIDLNLFSSKLGVQFRGNYVYGDDFCFCLKLLLNNQLVIYNPKLERINLINKSRMSLFYISKRMFWAGIERFIIDRECSSYPNHLNFFKESFTYFSFMKFLNNQPIIHLIFKIIFIFGYLSGIFIYASL